jgi:hypothetical protein
MNEKKVLSDLFKTFEKFISKYPELEHFLESIRDNNAKNIHFKDGPI